VVGDALIEDPPPGHVADAVGMGLPRPLRRVWPVLARQPLFSLAAGGLTAAFWAGVRLRRLGLELQAARALGSLETMRGVVART
jgi:hypothetical protein